jgi:hypothetical protein
MKEIIYEAPKEKSNHVKSQPLVGHRIEPPLTIHLLEMLYQEFPQRTLRNGDVRPFGGQLWCLQGHFLMIEERESFLACPNKIFQCIPQGEKVRY